MNGPLEHGDGGLTAAAGPAVASRAAGQSSPLAGRVADYCELAKVRLSLLVLIVTAIGYCLGHGTEVAGAAGLCHTLLGTALVAVAANALNQYLERRPDARMARTADRPLPAGRLSPGEALSFGVVTAASGLAWLAATGLFKAAALAGLTLGLYLLAYTPLKRRTVWNTFVGAVPGALPPLIGYAGAGRPLDALAWMLFAIVYVWQLPHFFAIAWMYRADYARGGFRMISVGQHGAVLTRRQTLFFAFVLWVVSLVPAAADRAGPLYLAGALVLGAVMTGAALNMARRLDRDSARTVLLTSIAYLPLLLVLLLIDRAGR